MEAQSHSVEWFPVGVHMAKSTSLIALIACAMALIPADCARAASRDGLDFTTLSISNTNWYPRELNYSVYLPSALDHSKPAPLIVNLHGGGGSEADLARFVPIIDELTQAGEFAPAIWTMPGVGRSFYINYRDGSAHWESILMEEYIPHLLANLNVDPERIYLIGVSMGGMGGLRLAFKYPDRFAGVAVLEPAIEAALRWSDLSPLDSFYREGQYEEKFGSPVDAAYWEANHPIAIAARDPERLRASGLAIYLECGDEDVLNLYRGAEYLHRVLFDADVRHEYRLVRGANHVGEKFLSLRYRDALQFIDRDMRPVDDGLDALPWIERTRERTQSMGPRVPLPPHR
jgi:S-formylglutathione hydrolase